MPARLVLGAGSTALAIIDAISDSRGPLHVVTDDDNRAETLRADGVSVTLGDPTDRDVLAGLDIDPDSVIVATEDSSTNAGAAELARELFSNAFLLSYVGFAASAEDQDRIAAISDEVVQPESLLTDHLNRSIGSDGQRIRQLQGIFRDIAGHLAIVTHDNPDPDAIASAIALGALAERAGCSVSICYYGDISHQENRAFVNLLEYDLVNLDSEDEDALAPYDGFALVDHSRPGVNDQLPEDLPIDIVIDHHPPRLPVEARYVDLRSGAGATSTLLVDYFRRYGLEIPERIATGLLFGIHVDTREFRREVSVEDFEAASHLVSQADMGTLQRIEDPSVSSETLEVVGRAISNRVTEGSVLLSSVGELSDRDALAQAADRLLNLEDIHATVVYGVLDETIYVSARARGADIDLGEVLRDAFGQIGSAGGHADMAGAQIELGVLDAVDEREEPLHEIVSSVINDRVLEAVQSRSHRLLGNVHTAADYGPEAYARQNIVLDDDT